jgi:hypothetical protein
MERDKLSEFVQETIEKAQAFRKEQFGKSQELYDALGGLMAKAIRIKEQLGK